MVKRCERWVRQVKPRDIIALVTLVGCLVLLARGVDGEVKGLMGVIIGSYFLGKK